MRPSTTPSKTGCPTRFPGFTSGDMGSPAYGIVYTDRKSSLFTRRACCPLYIAHETTARGGSLPGFSFSTYPNLPEGSTAAPDPMRVGKASEGVAQPHDFQSPIQNDRLPGR